MITAHQSLAALVACAMLTLPRLATAQSAPAIPPSLTTPDKVETRIGTLDFKDGAPSKATLDKVYDNLDFTHAYARSSTPCRASASTPSARACRASASRRTRSSSSPN